MTIFPLPAILCNREARPIILKDKILTHLINNKDEIVTGGELANRLGVSRTAVWKAICSLREDGCEIESLQNSGYRFASAGDALSEAVIRSSLTTSFIGRRIDILKTTPSTSQYIKERISRGSTELPEGCVALADAQTGGRGRMNRPFSSPKGEGVYMSLLLKPSIPPEEVQFLTICAAVAVSNALQNVCGFEPTIKWVNDIYYGGKKLCGILTEALLCAEMGMIDSIVVGIGINTGRVAEEVRGVAVSVLEITGERGGRNAIAAEVLNQLEGIYMNFTRHGKKQEILQDYARRQYLAGRLVTVTGPGADPYEATAVGIDGAGGMIIKMDDGTTRHLNSGEVSIRDRG